MKKVSFILSTLIIVLAAACKPTETPGFSLSAANLDIQQGATNTVTIAITRSGGFNQMIDLSLSGLPAGVTESFSENPAAGNSVSLSLDLSDSSPVGEHTITLNGTAGTLTESTSFMLKVTAAPDTNAPSIVSITPADGAIGVAKDVNIVITFSEKMNQAATQAAYQSADILPGFVTFSWNAEGTELTIDPAFDLAYSATGQEYSFSISNTATDLAGNQLASVSSSFTTFRQITVNLYSVAALDGDVRSDGTVNGCLGVNTFCVGDSGLVGNASYRGFLSFDLSSLPAELQSANIISATLWVYQEGVSGMPYSDLDDCLIIFGCDDLLIDHVNYDSSLNDSDFDATVLHVLGELPSTTTLEWKTFNVKDAAADDWDNRSSRGDRSQYRLRFAKLTDGDGVFDAAEFTSGDAASNKPQLQITYLIP